MKSKLLISLCTLAATTSLAYAEIPPRPASCPGVASIQQTPFLASEQEKNGKYMAVQISSYDTYNAWGFVIGEIVASSKEDALNKANSVIYTLHFNSGPSYFDKQNEWVCLYDVGNNYLALALTPLPSNAVTGSALFKAIPASVFKK